jgi:PAS domain S-box-containing protein
MRSEHRRETESTGSARRKAKLAAAVEAERIQFAEVFKESPLFMAILRGPTHVFEFVNDRYLELIGQRDIIGKPVREALPEVEGQGFFELLDRVYATGERCGGKEMRLLLDRQPGQSPEERFVEFIYQATRRPDGSISGILAYGIDLTERKRAEAVRERLASVVHSAPDFIGISDLTGIPIFGNRSAMNMLGEDDWEKVRQTPLSEFLVPEDQPFFRDEVLPAVLRDGRWKGELRIRNQKTGSVIPVLYGLFRIDEPQTGKPAHLATISRDITDAKRAEEARHQLAAKLERQTRIFDTTLSSITDFAYIFDREGRFIYANPPLLKLWGLRLEDAVGKNFFELKYPPELAEKLQRQINQVIETRQVVTDDTPYTSPTGISGHYEYILSPVMAADGTVEVVAGSTRDITRRKEAELEREQLLASERAARSEAERAGRMKDDFLTTLSHELRTPLNAILGWSQILRSGVGGEDLAEGLATIERNARAQTEIIQDLLDMSGIISGKVRLDVQRVELASLLQAGVDTLRPAAEAKEVRLHAVLDPKAGPVSGDPNRLQQVFWNLLSNAVKFTPKGGRVQVRLERVDSHVEISVIDTGEGIGPEFLPYVFDRFRQADATTTRRHGGLGLGLSIVKQLVELHGGSVRVKSMGVGQGTTFTVSLPLVVVHPEPQPEVKREHPAASVPADLYREACLQLKGVRVLVVDDEPDARSVVRRVLEDCGAAVQTASSSAEALDMFQSEPPDVLVSDIGMPVEDGYTLVRRVRALGKDKGGNTPALALTAYARPEDRMRAVRAGFEMHVVKPVEPVELITMVATLAERAAH